MGASEVFKFEIILFYRTVFNFDVMQVNWPNYIDKYVQVKPGLKPVFQALKSQFKAETIWMNAFHTIFFSIETIQLVQL